MVAGRVVGVSEAPGHHPIMVPPPVTFPSCDSMLIDGKNQIYRSIYAGHADPRFMASGHSYFVVFMRFLSSYLNKFRPKSVHVFWDAPTDTLWRKKVYPLYKDQRHDSADRNGFDIKPELKKQMAITIQVLRSLGVRQYFGEGQEADDLIYAFAYSNFGNKNLIISSDGDFKQIVYRFPHAMMYNPLKKGGLEERPERDPVLVKSFIGDKSDNISGYYQVGKVRAIPLVDDLIARKKFFESPKAISEDRQVVGNAIFERNRQIIDLGLSPSLRDNISYIESRQVEPIAYDLKQVEALAQRYQVHGLMADATNLLFPFKHLV